MTGFNKSLVLRSIIHSLHKQSAPVILRTAQPLCRIEVTHSTIPLHTHHHFSHSSKLSQNYGAQAFRALLPSSNSQVRLHKTSLGVCDPEGPSRRGFKTRDTAERIAYTSSATPPSPLQSSAGTWTVVVVASVITVLYAFSSNEAQSPTATKEQPPISEGLAFLLAAEGIENVDMADAQLPGRVGNLTSEEEEKLKEFWVATLQVFGVLDSKDQNGTADTSNEKSDAGSMKKPKKKRFSMLRRGGNDDDSVKSSGSGSKTPIGAEDDKYGQTKEFHDALANLSPETLRTTFWSMVKHDHPDALLLRFLRARKWDVDKALVMMISTMRWRAMDMHVDDDIMKNGELGALEDADGTDLVKAKLGKDFLAQMRLGKSFLHGLDKGGRPMCFVRARLHKQGDQSEESLERYTVFTIETARMILAPPADTACVVFDMTGFSLANMDYAPVKFMIKCFEANYPESLGVVLVHKAPWVFQGIWKIIRGWLDPVVASKIQFTSNDTEMEQFVSRDHIIKELSGGEDWSYNYIEPVPGENDKMKDTATRDKLLHEREATVNAYEKETLEWIHSTPGADIAVFKKKRNDMAATLRDGYWVLDPYVRARSYYDRCGLIGPEGEAHFYPSKAPASAPNGAPKPVETSADDID